MAQTTPSSAEDLEGVAPAHIVHHQLHQRRREGAAPSRAQPHDALRAHALLLRQPGGEGLGEVGKAARFARAEQEARDHQRRVKFQAQPVAAVKKHHHSTMRMSTLRGPMRSPR